MMRDKMKKELMRGKTEEEVADERKDCVKEKLMRGRTE
jgi:hypothetical protein